MIIKGLKIGNGNKARVIAELGTLHFHEEEIDILRVIADSVNAGADLVKLQLINPETAWWASERAYLRYKELYERWPIDRVIGLIKRANIIFNEPIFLSIFDSNYFDNEELIRELPAIKLGYKANMMPRLREKAYKSLKPLIISVNKESEKEVIEREIKELGLDKIERKYLYVQPIYPTRKDQVIMPRYKAFEGLSTHLREYEEIILQASLMNCEILEVHVKGSNPQGVDKHFALSINELREVCTHLKH